MGGIEGGSWEGNRRNGIETRSETIEDRPEQAPDDQKSSFVFDGVRYEIKQSAIVVGAVICLPLLIDDEVGYRMFRIDSVSATEPKKVIRVSQLQIALGNQAMDWLVTHNGAERLVIPAVSQPTYESGRAVNVAVTELGKLLAAGVADERVDAVVYELEEMYRSLLKASPVPQHEVDWANTLQFIAKALADTRLERLGIYSEFAYKEEVPTPQKNHKQV